MSAFQYEYWQSINSSVFISLSPPLSLFLSLSRARAQLSSKEMESVTQVQILDETICIFLHDNALGKGINSTLLPTHPHFTNG